MAYDTSNPPALASQVNGTNGVRRWTYKSADPLATVVGAGYVTDADDLGMQVGDEVFMVDTTNSLSWTLQVSAVSAAGAATLVEINDSV